MIGMPALKQIVKYLDSLFEPIPDDESVNGLQVEGRPQVRRVALVTDACLDTIRKAIAWKADMLLAHHGIIWQKAKITGVRQRLFKALLAADLSLYAQHLPLDAHRQLGNNAQILKVLGIKPKAPFCLCHGKAIGWWGEVKRPLSRGEFTKQVERKLGNIITVFAGGPELVKRVGVVSGGGWMGILEVEELGIDTFITGDVSYHFHHGAPDIGVNVICAGHFATEQWGIKALGAVLKSKFPELQIRFIQQPVKW